ncbi:permease prefix domain 1-containing protein [Paenibacillus filicis]|uniref:Permease prefix domain 1-containing protein n=1 Tax=Paenibacillus filicis TaxID=669464 RepID=A0ABU9DUJ0_9BACL
MNLLQAHVERLFRPYPANSRTDELKDEILGNLESKVADLTSGGMEYGAAVRKAIEHMNTVDFLMEGTSRIYIHRFWTELSQVALLYALIAWIVTIPIQVAGIGALLNLSLLVIAFIVGCLFAGLRLWSAPRDKVAVFRLASISRYSRLAWQVWGLYIVVSVLGVTAVQFGSNIWFSRPVTLSGPYQWGVVAIRYALPFVSVLIPLLFTASIKLAHKHEAGGDDDFVDA